MVETGSLICDPRRLDVNVMIHKDREAPVGTDGHVMPTHEIMGKES